MNTPGRRQSKMPILSRNVYQKSIETVFSIAICRPTGYKWQSKTLFLLIFYPHSSIVDYIFDCRLPGVMKDTKQTKKIEYILHILTQQCQLYGVRIQTKKFCQQETKNIFKTKCKLNVNATILFLLLSNYRKQIEWMKTSFKCLVISFSLILRKSYSVRLYLIQEIVF